MKLIIAGSRDMKSFGCLGLSIVSAMRQGLLVDDVSEVVSGCATGVDTFGEEWAIQRNIPIKRFRADWKNLGKAAGPIRNQQMAEYADAALIVMWEGGTKGSMNMVENMKKLNKPVYINYIQKDSNET